MIKNKVSIIMGVYNGEKTIDLAIQSIMQQTYSNWELIICDDGSSDNTKKIIEKYISDSRIKLIFNAKNRGLAASLNKCISMVEGEYIARMDCDDFSVNTRLEDQVNYLEKNRDVHLVGSYMQEFDQNGKKNVIEMKEKPTKFDLPKGAPFSHATIMIRTEILKSLNGYRVCQETSRTEDVDLWYRFFEKEYVGVNLPKVLYYVRMDRDAYKRRKLKYMFHASKLIWKGCSQVGLPVVYKVYAIKPILSWILPPNIKIKLRKWIIK